MVPSSGSGDDPAGPSASRHDTKRPTRESPAWPRRRTAQLVALAIVVVALAGAALAFRAHHRKQVVAKFCTQVVEACGQTGGEAAADQGCRDFGSPAAAAC